MKKQSKKALNKKASKKSQAVMAAAGGTPGNGMTIKSYQSKGNKAYS